MEAKMGSRNKLGRMREDGSCVREERNISEVKKEGRVSKKQRRRRGCLY